MSYGYSTMQDWRNSTPSTALLELQRLGDLPVSDLMVKAASQEFHVFADAKHKTFPVDTAEATLLSAGHYFGNGGEDKEVVGALHKAARAFGIGDGVQTIQGFFEDQIKMASEISPPEEMVKYAFDDGTVRAYPVGTELDLDLSARGMVADLIEGRIPSAVARQAALVMCKQAHETGVKLPERVLALGNSVAQDWERVADAAAGRVRHGMREDDAGMLVQLTKAAAATARHGISGEDAVTPEQLAEAWADLDSVNNVKYAKAATPHEIVFSGESAYMLEKAASEFTALGNCPVPLAALAGITDAQWGAFLDADDATAACSLSKQASVSFRDADKAVQEIPDAQQKRILSGFLDIVKTA